MICGIIYHVCSIFPMICFPMIIFPMICSDLKGHISSTAQPAVPPVQFPQRYEGIFCGTSGGATVATALEATHRHSVIRDVIREDVETFNGDSMVISWGLMGL